jgi:hypothetical protein
MLRLGEAHFALDLARGSAAQRRSEALTDVSPPVGLSGAGFAPAKGIGSQCVAPQIAAWLAEALKRRRLV